tara:strand:- start:102 stop:392 length:291 start_codon:yes stop_codon:yes gene_type:complete
MESKMNSKKDYNEVLEFQELLYHVLHQHTNEAIADEIHPSTVLNIQAAVLLKTAVELYTIHFRKDVDVQKILDVAKSTVSSVRDRIDTEINPQTYH